MSGGTISGTITTTVTLGSAGYFSPLTIAATGNIDPAASFAAGVYLAPATSGTVINYGTIIGGTDAPAAVSAYGTLQLKNFGVILAGLNAAGFGSFAVHLSTAGELYNAGTLGNVGLGGSASLVNDGLIDGIASDSGTGTILNAGSIDGGVDLLAGATGANSGTIYGSDVGAAFRYPSNYYHGPNQIYPNRLYSAAIYGSFTNTGVIDGTEGPGTGGGVVAGGAFLNRGTVTGGSTGSLGGTGAIGGRLTGSQSINYGTIQGGYGSSAGGNGIDENGDGAVITNFGTIIGGNSKNNGGVGVAAKNYIYGPGGAADLDTLTFVNAGLVEGGVGFNGVRGDALQGGGAGTFTLIVEPGASFVGNVEGSGVLQLAGSSGIALTGIGSSISGFSTISFTTGAAWTAAGDAAGLADGQTIAGFTLNDTIVLDGFAATSHTYVTGTGLELSNGVITETLDISGGSSAAAFAVTSGASATTISLIDDHTISNTVATSVTLGSIYLSPLTITATGAIAPAATDSATGLYADTGTVTNQGAITGGADSGVAGAENFGGIGVGLNGATLFNTGIITGGADLYISGNHESPSHAGGIGLSLAGGMVTNSGNISGGVAGGIEGVGGVAAVLTGGALTNTGTITGGGGGAGGGGGIGASLTNASLQNNGLIAGGDASTLAAIFGGVGGYGVALFDGATLSNTGTITGGVIETAIDSGGGGGGILLDGGEATTSGTVTGGGGYILGGAGVQLLAGSLINESGITGGYGSRLSGGGVVMTGGTFTNTASGTVTGGRGNGFGGESGAGVFLSGGTATNNGAILGGNIAGDPGSGGAGVYLNGGTLTNDARITGGDALPVNGGAIYGSGGPGALILAGGLTNNGTVTGGSGTIGGEGATIAAGTIDNLGLIIGGNGGIGVRQSGGSISNAGSITGGGGGTAAGAGGAGAVLSSGMLLNTGAVSGGGGTDGGNGGDAIDLRSGTLNNSGIITGGDAGAATLKAFAGIGVSIDNGAFINSGTVAGGYGGYYGYGGDAVVLDGGSVSNTGAITGGHGGSSAGKGVDLLSGTFTNDGIISGGIFDGFGTGAGISGGTLINDSDGTITGGLGGGGGGVSLSGGTLMNAGNVFGASTAGDPFKYGPGGAGAVVTGGTLFNTGIITGGKGVSASGNGVDISGGTLIDAGTIIAGAGQLAVDFTAPALLVVEPGAVFAGGVDGAGTLELAGSSSVALTGIGTDIAGFSTIDFAIGAAWDVVGDAAGLANGQTIFGFAAGDTIILDGFTAASDSFIPGTGLELSNGSLNETLDLIGNFSTNSFIVLDQPGETEIQLCYLRGTRILTPAGELPIETLNIGDAVITRFNGYRRIKWIGRQSFGRRFIGTNRAQRPIRITAGALGPHLPKRDLYVSPGHSMLIGNLLVLASSLVNGITITQTECPDEVHYYQLEFETHDCVQAEGCWSESFCDYADLRNQFHNVADFHCLFPHHVTPAKHLMCASRPEHGVLFESALRPVVARASALVPPGPLQGWIDDIHPSGVITGWAQDTAHPELPVVLEILLHQRALGTVLACDYRADLATAGIAQGRAAFTYKSPAKIPRAALPAVQIRRAVDGANLPIASHCLTDLAATAKSRRKRA